MEVLATAIVTGPRTVTGAIEMVIAAEAVTTGATTEIGTGIVTGTGIAIVTGIGIAMIETATEGIMTLRGTLG
jgi:hypothetical protein